nr:splicing factor U2af large subunit B-like isoform X2 [Lolium perenne]
MAGRPFVFEKNWAENPPLRRPATDMEFPPGLSPADPPQVRVSDRRAHQQVHHRCSPEPHQVDGATRVVRLAKVLSLDQLQDDQVYQQVLDELTQEARKFGDLLKVVLPRPIRGAAHPVASEDGKVFLEYACLEDSIQCRIRLDGQWFDGTKIIAGYFPEDKFAAGDYDYDG